MPDPRRALRRHAPYLAGGLALLALLLPSPRQPPGPVDGLGQDPGAGTALPGTSLDPLTAVPTAAPTAAGANGVGQPGTPRAPGSAGAAGRTSGPGTTSSAALPCLPRPILAGCKPGWGGGENGGVTGHNVGADRVVVVWYVTYVDSSLRATQSAAGTAYSEEQVRGDVAALQAFLRKNVQTYGRRLDVVPYFGSHPVTDDAGLKAEAVELDTQVKAFAVTSGTMPVALSDELVRRKVLAWNTFQQSSAYYAKKAPYAWSVTGEADLLNAATAEYARKRLAGRPADFAGTGVQGNPRKFGLAYEGVLEPSAQDLIARMKAAGTPFAATVQFGSELGTAAQGALNVVSQMRSAGVTTLITIGNVFAPLFITQAADSQQWYPEYFVNGYLFQDAEEAARQYTPTQWSHAFGFTQIAVRNDYRTGVGYAAAKQGNPSYEPSGGIALMFLSLTPIARGIETVGPQLDAFRFRDALFSLPAVPGKPARQGNSFGPNGPGPYTAADDFAEIWWDPAASDTFDGRAGAYQRTDGGRRYRLGGWPSTVPAVFR